MSIKFLVLGGGYFGFWGGGECRFYFYGREDFSDKFTGERFTNHSNHIHRFIPITRIVATKAPTILQELCRSTPAQILHNLRGQKLNTNFFLDAVFCLQLEASCLQWSFFSYS